jgi:TIMELESS-interacting protein
VERTSPVDDVTGDGDVGLEDLNKDVADDDIQEDLFDELYRQAVGEDPNSSSQKGSENVVDSHSFSQAPILNNTSEEQGWQQSQNEVNGQGKSENQITEEQKTRMEANRLKALERAAARASQLQAQ